MLKSLTIGSLTVAHNVVLAPLAGITNLPFRLICRRLGASLAFTEMVSVNGLVREGLKTLALLKSCDEDRPLGIQLFGDKPVDLAEAARMVEGYGDLLDINMGCPVRKVVGTGAGSALLQDPLKVAAIVRTVRAATRLPLTIKIRSGWHCGDDVYPHIARIAEAEGCDAVTLHPRSRSQMFSGQADWDQIRLIKAALSIPVLGSGDLFTAQDCFDLMRETGVDGVAVARGAIGNPWIFEQARALAAGVVLPPPSLHRQREVIAEHYRMADELYGPARACRVMRKFGIKYARLHPQPQQVRDAFVAVHQPNQWQSVLDRWYAEDLPGVQPTGPGDSFYASNT